SPPPAAASVRTSSTTRSTATPTSTAGTPPVPASRSTNPRGSPRPSRTTSSSCRGTSRTRSSHSSTTSGSGAGRASYPSRRLPSSTGRQRGAPDEGGALRRRHGDADARVLGVRSQAVGADRDAPDHLPPDEVLRALRAHRVHRLPRVQGRGDQGVLPALQGVVEQRLRALRRRSRD